MAEGRLPPFDLDAEAATLSACILSPQAVDEVADILDRSRFYSPANGKTFECIIALRNEGRPIDTVTLKSSLAGRGWLESVGGARYLLELQDAVPYVANVGEYARIILEKARQRDMITTCQRIAAEGYGDVGDVGKWVDASEQSIFAIASQEQTKRPQQIGSILREHYADIQARLRAKAAERLTTGLESLDKQIVGMQAPDLIVLAAQPGNGKTALASSIAMHVAQQHGAAVVFSLEMSREQLTDRAICSLAGVDSRDMANPERLTQSDWSRITAAANDIASAALWIDDEPAISLTALRAKSRRIAAEAKAAGQPLRLIVLDYLQLMGVNPKATSREQQVAENSRGLKALAKDLGVPVMALSQLNRQSEATKSKRPQLRHLRESGAIEQDADQVWFLYREDDDPEGATRLDVAKGRNFGTGEIVLTFNRRFTRFEDMSEAEQERVKGGKRQW